MEDILRVPEDNSGVVGLTPLLFIVASETTSKPEFDITITKLEALLKISGLANISRALDLFHKMEQPGSTHWRSLVRGFQWDLIVC